MTPAFRTGSSIAHTRPESMQKVFGSGRKRENERGALRTGLANTTTHKERCRTPPSATNGGVVSLTIELRKAYWGTSLFGAQPVISQFGTESTVLTSRQKRKAATLSRGIPKFGVVYLLMTTAAVTTVASTTATAIVPAATAPAATATSATSAISATERATAASSGARGLIPIKIWFR